MGLLPQRTRILAQLATVALTLAFAVLTTSGAVLDVEEHNAADLRRLGAQELLRRAGMKHGQPAEMAEMEAQLGAQAETADDVNAQQMAAAAPPLAHSGGSEEVDMDDVEKKLAQVGLPSDAISAAVDEAVDSGSIQDPEEMKPAERAAVTAKVADAVARDQSEATPGGGSSRDPWSAFANSLQETGVGSKCTTTCTRNRRTKMNKCETVCEPHSGTPLAKVVVPPMRTADVTLPGGKLGKTVNSGSDEEEQDSGGNEEKQDSGGTKEEQESSGTEEEQDSSGTEEEVA